MAQIKWQPLFETGVAHIDNQHRELVRILNRLEQSVASGESDEAVRTALHEMARYTATHFQTEEAFMRQINFPELEPHSAIHRQLVARVEGYQARSDAPAGVKGNELLGMLTDWLLDHIVVEDKKYARWAEMHRTINA